MTYMDQRGENYIFYQKLNLNPEQQYTRDAMDRRFGQKLKLIFMMTGRDFHNDRSRFCYE